MRRTALASALALLALPAPGLAANAPIDLPLEGADLSTVAVPGEEGRLVAADPCYPADLCEPLPAEASDDGGRTWSPIPGGPTGILTATPGVPHVVWAIREGGRPLRSADGGRTWHGGGRRRLRTVTPIGLTSALATPLADLPIPLPGEHVYCDRLPPYALAARRLLRTDDGGRSWRPVLATAERRYIEALATSPGRPTTVVVAVGTVRMRRWCRPSVEGARIWRSADGGRTWRALARVPGAVGALAIEPERVLVGRSDGGLVELRRGAAPRLLARLRGPISQIVVRPDGRLLVRARGRLRLYSATGAAEAPPPGLPADADAIALAGATGLVATGGDAVRTADGGLTFTADATLPADPRGTPALGLLGPGLPVLGGYSGLLRLDAAGWTAFGPAAGGASIGTPMPTSSGARVFMGTWSVAAVEPFSYRRIGLGGRLQASDDGGATWRPFPLPAGARIQAIDADDADRMVVQVAFREDGYRLTEDGGATWRPLAVPVIPHFGPALAVRGATLVASLVDGTLRRSDDGGRTWRRTPGPGCTSYAPPAVVLARVAGALRAVADCARLSVVPRPAGDLVLALDDGVAARASADAGATWVDLGLHDVRALVGDPAGGAWAITGPSTGPKHLVHVETP